MMMFLLDLALVYMNFEMYAHGASIVLEMILSQGNTRLLELSLCYM